MKISVTAIFKLLADSNGKPFERAQTLLPEIDLRINQNAANDLWFLRLSQISQLVASDFNKGTMRDFTADELHYINTGEVRESLKRVA